MSFLAPIFGWAFLSLIPLAAIYFLKVRPRKKMTTAYFLWSKVFTEKRSSSLFNRLRDVWSLLLMLLAFSAVALALMKPEFERGDRKDLLIFIDHSASMSAQEGSTSRLDRALGEARRIVQALDGVQRAAIAAVASEIRFVSHLTESPRELVEALGKIEPTQLPLNGRILDDLYAGADKKWTENYRILLITDGSSSTGGTLPEGMELLKVGEPKENMGIAAADARLQLGEEPSVSVYIQIASSFSQARDVDVIFSRRDTELPGKIIPFAVVPGLNEPEIFSVEGFGPGEYELSLDMKDALEEDNLVALAVAEPRPVTVSVESEDQFFLQNAVLAFTQSGGLLQLVAEGAQMALAKSKTPEATLSLVFAPAGESPWWGGLGDEIDGAVPRVLVKDHPVLRMLDAGSIDFVGARQLVAPENALVLVVSDEDVPLLYVVRAGGKSAVVVNMDPLTAEFYFSARFPVLVHGAATYLAGREETLDASYAMGTTAAVPGVQEGESTRVTAPGGAARTLTGKAYGPLNALGFHELENTAGNWPVAVSLLSSGESLLDNASVADTSKPISKGWSLSYLLTALAIAVLCLESILYHRRKVG